MGCASSVHVSQRTGVVYCRDDEDNEKDPENRRNSGLQPIHVSKRLSTASLSISEVDYYLFKWLSPVETIAPLL